MSQRHIDRLIDGLAEQGCRIRKIRAGAFVYCPDGIHTICIHTSKHSDIRALRNLRAEVRRYGLEWPSGVL